MDIATIFTFTIATALIVAIPGPSILMIVAAGVAGGRRAALGALFAILAADVILIGLVASGLGALAELGGDSAREALRARKPSESREDMRKALDEALVHLDRPDSEQQLAREVEELKGRNRDLERRVKDLEQETKSP